MRRVDFELEDFESEDFELVGAAVAAGASTNTKWV